MARNKLLTEGEVRKFMKLANLAPLSENYFTNNPLDEQEDELEVEDEFEVGAVEDEVPVDDAGLEGEEGGEAEELVVDLLQHIQDWGEQHGVDMDLGVDGEEGGEEEELEVDAELEGPGGDVEMEFGAEEEEVPGNMDLYQEGWNTPKASGKASSTKAGKQDRSDVANKATGRWLKEEEEDIDEAYAAAKSPPHRSPRTSKKCYDSDGNRVECSDQQADSAADAGRAGETRAQMEELNQEEIVAEVSRRVAARLMADKKKENMADQLAERIFSRLTAK